MKKKHSRFPSILASALRQSIREGYGLKDLKADLLAGCVVGMIAIPLGMALAIATGVQPQYGLYTVIFSGIIALLGGSRFSVSGPTAAFVVILAPIVAHHGLSGLLLASFLAGFILLVLGLTGLGQVISFIPYPVTTGFTSGIAVVIAAIQIKDFFGLKFEHSPDSFFERLWVLMQHASTFSIYESSAACLTLLLLILGPKISKIIPSPVFALGVMSSLVAYWNQSNPTLALATIRDRFSYTVDGTVFKGIPTSLPHFHWPWEADPLASFSLSFSSLEPIILASIAIAMLSAIESLLCAVVADGITQTRHDPNNELVAQGLGNMLGAFFGAIPATGAVVRTATNIRFGAKSPFAAIFHAIFVMLILIFFGNYVSYMPMASLAALLMFVAYGMFDHKHFFHCLHLSPRSDKAVLLTCFALTVSFDMVIGVTVGIILASLLFIKRMSELTTSSQWNGTHHKVSENIPSEITIYEIAGPLFFGAAERAIEGVKIVRKETRSVIFNLEHVPTIDLSGLIAFESAMLELLTRSVSIHIVATHPETKHILKKSKVLKNNEQITLADSLESAVRHAKNDLLKGLI